MRFKPTKRPLFGNGEGFTITSTSSAAPHTVFTARGVSEGWDECWIYASNTANNPRTLFLRVGTTAAFSRINIQNGAYMSLITPGGREALVYRGGQVIQVYASASGLILHGNVIEVAVE